MSLMMDDPSFYEDFLIECGEHFEKMEAYFLEIEESPEDLSLLNDIFRSIHTIKGASGFLGLTEIGELTHKAENVLDDLRKEKFKINEDIMDALFESFDVLKLLTTNVRKMLNNEEMEDG